MRNGTINQDLLQIAQMGAQRDKEARAARKVQKLAKQQEAAFRAFLDMVCPTSETDIPDTLDDLLKRVDAARNARKGAVQSMFTFRDNLPMGDVAVEADIRAQWVRNGWKVA